MAQQTSDLRSLLNGMHELLNAGGLNPTYESVELSDVLGQVEQAYAPMAHAKQLKFVVKQRPDRIWLWTDRAATMRILNNLVSNAIKYTVQGTVIVSALHLKQQGVARIDVRDSGVGIPPECSEDIYKEFVRGQNTGNEQGLGLGLAIVKLLREKLSGHYVDHHSIVGKGSRFSLTLPTTDHVPGDVSNEADSATLKALNVSRAYVIVVEDNADVRQALVNALSEGGYCVNDFVREAATLSQLREIFECNAYRAPDLVITDYRLCERGPARESANDVMRLVDEIFGWKRVPIIVLTAEIHPVLIERSPLYVLSKADGIGKLLRTARHAIQEARSASVDGLEDAS
jgi:CheY-like chemotaxis protein/two-component sensor histidine kinase